MVSSYFIEEVTMTKLEGHGCQGRTMVRQQNSVDGAIASCKRNPACVAVYDRYCKGHIGQVCLKLDSGNEITANGGSSCVYKKGN